MKRMFSGIAIISLFALPLSAQAQFAKIEDAVKYRKAVLSVMNTHLARIGSTVKGERPYDKASVESDATIVEMMAKLPWHAFPANSITSDSRAKPEIWKEQDKFRAAADKMQSETAKLSAAAKAGDLNMIKTTFGSAAQSCKACHDDFRKN
jgi:cytochrome c556